MLTEEQINLLSTIKFLNVIDEQVKVLSEYEVKYLPAAPNVVGRIILVLNIFFKGEKYSEISFDLQNYDYDELAEIAKNIKCNEFIMYELDQHLAGSMD